MKSKSSFKSSVPLIAIFSLISPIVAWSTDSATNAVPVPVPLAETKDGSRTVARENLGCDLVEGRTNRIARVYSADPISVYVIYKDGLGGRRILRQDLPPELKAKYPYDAEKAAEYRRQQAETAAQQLAVQQEALRRMARMRDQAVLNQIEALRNRDVELQKEKNILNGLPPGHGRRIRARHIDDEQEGLRKQIAELQKQIGQGRPQIAGSP